MSGWRNQDGFLEEAALTMDLERVEDTPLAEKGRPGEGHSIGQGREVVSEGPAQMSRYQHHLTWEFPGHPVVRTL